MVANELIAQGLSDLDSRIWLFSISRLVTRCLWNKEHLDHEKEFITVALHGTDYPVATMIAQTGITEFIIDRFCEVVGARSLASPC